MGTGRAQVLPLCLTQSLPKMSYKDGALHYMLIQYDVVIVPVLSQQHC